MNELISGLRGFTFNGKHNRDMGVVMHSKTIQSPSKKKIKESVPYMNGGYDFSTIGSSGEITYSEREITIVLGLPADTKERLQIMYSSVLEWIVDAGKQQLIFDVMDDYYFMAEVEESTSLEETMAFGQLELKFIAEPFKKSIDYYGNNKWDTFNFDEDRLQESSYNVSGSDSIILYNPGRKVQPIISCTSAMTIIQNGRSYNLSIGDNKLYGFYLNTNVNALTVSGTGKISFMFRKESI